MLLPLFEETSFLLDEGKVGIPSRFLEPSISELEPQSTTLMEEEEEEEDESVIIAGKM